MEDLKGDTSASRNERTPIVLFDVLCFSFSVDKVSSLHGLLARMTHLGTSISLPKAYRSITQGLHTGYIFLFFFRFECVVVCDGVVHHRVLVELFMRRVVVCDGVVHPRVLVELFMRRVVVCDGVVHLRVLVVRSPSHIFSFVVG